MTHQNPPDRRGADRRRLRRRAALDGSAGLPVYIAPDAVDESIRTGSCMHRSATMCSSNATSIAWVARWGVWPENSRPRIHPCHATASAVAATIISSVGRRGCRKASSPSCRWAGPRGRGLPHRRAGLRSAAAYRSPSTGGVFASWGNDAVDVPRRGSWRRHRIRRPPRGRDRHGERPDATSHNAEAAIVTATSTRSCPRNTHQEWLESA